MKIAYIFIRFPVWSETFAINDIVCLKSKCPDTAAYTLRGQSSSDDITISSSLDVNYANVFTMLKGLFIALLNFPILLNYFIWLTKREHKRPIQFLKCITFLPQIFYLWKELEKRNVNVVHLFWGHYSAGLGYLIKKKSKIKVFSVFLGAYDLELALNSSIDVANLSDVVWTHSRFNVERLISLGINRDKIRVAHRGVNLEYFPPVKEKNAIRILTSGRLNKEKGFEDVLSVFSNLLKIHPSLELLLMGDGDYKNDLIEYARKLNITNKVTFTGRVTQKRVLEEMSRANIFLFMSKYKGDRLPNVVKEAMANNCACVVTNTSAIEEMVTDNVNGFIVPMGDVSKATEICLNLLSDPTFSAQVGAKAREQIFANFSVEASISSYLDHWRSLQ